jgi:hypothetical protein
LCPHIEGLSKPPTHEAKVVTVQVHLPICLAIDIDPANIGPMTQTEPQAVLLTYAEFLRAKPSAATFQIVLVPLFGPSFDALDLVEGLADQGFTGTLRVVAPRLPNMHLVLRELQTAATRKGITVEMIERA